MIEFKPSPLAPNFNVGPYLPSFFSEGDPRPAAEQLNERYSYGGGFAPLDGFTLEGDWTKPAGATLRYPEDEPLYELCRARLRDETLIFFESSWLAIIQPDGSFVATRAD